MDTTNVNNKGFGMRDCEAESLWVNHPVIGYIPLDEFGRPYQPTVGRHHHSRVKPVTVYKTIARAVSYSPCGSASEVRVFEPILVVKSDGS